MGRINKKTESLGCRAQVKHSVVYASCVAPWSTRVETNPSWDLSCVYKRQVGIKCEDFNKPFSYHPYNFLKKDPAKYTRSLLNPGWTVNMYFSALFNPGWKFNPGWTVNPTSKPRLRFNRGWYFSPGCHVNARFILRACRVESQPGFKLVMWT